MLKVVERREARHIAGRRLGYECVRGKEEEGRVKGGMKKGIGKGERGKGKVTGENGAVLLYGEVMVCGVDEGNGTEG